VIVAPMVKLKHGLDWFFQKFGMARDVEPGWKEREEDTTTKIGDYVRKQVDLGAQNTQAPTTQDFKAKLSGLKAAEEEATPNKVTPFPKTPRTDA
jgi:hypothetical protein